MGRCLSTVDTTAVWLADSSLWSMSVLGMCLGARLCPAVMLSCTKISGTAFTSSSASSAASFAATIAMDARCSATGFRMVVGRRRFGDCWFTRLLRMARCRRWYSPMPMAAKTITNGTSTPTMIGVLLGGGTTGPYSTSFGTLLVSVLTSMTIGVEMLAASAMVPRSA